MKIAIIGAGALGTLFGGLLAKSGEEVWLYNPSFKEHIEYMKDMGLMIEGKDGKYHLQVNATEKIQKIGKADLVGIFVKAYCTGKATKDALPLVSRDTQVFSLQNGLGNTEQIAKYVPSPQIIRGVTSLGSTLVSPGYVRWAGYGDTYLANISKKSSKRLEEVIEVFNRAGIKTYLAEDIEEEIWRKLLINVGINSLTAIFNVKNGTLLTRETFREVMHHTVREGVEVAKGAGIDLNFDETIKEVEKICQLTSENISSMLQDVRKDKRTEIDYINGAIIREGRKRGIKTPINKLLTLLINEKVFAAAHGGKQ